MRWRHEQSRRSLAVVDVPQVWIRAVYMVGSKPSPEVWMPGLQEEDMNTSEVIRIVGMIMLGLVFHVYMLRMFREPKP